MEPWKISQHIPSGGTTNPELRALYQLASSLPPDATVVEIGAGRGRGTLVLAQALTDGCGGTVVTIDPLIYMESLPITWTGIAADFKENIRQSGFKSIELIQEYSSEAGKTFDRPIHLLFIDGDHSYEGVRKDYELFSPHLVPGGVIAFHDVGVSKGPKRLVKEEIYGNPEYSGLRTVRSMLYAVKAPGSQGGQPFHRLWHGGYFQLSRLYQALLALKK